MSKIKKFFISVLTLIVLLILLLYLTGHGYILTAAKVIYGNGHITSFIDDYRFFPTRKINNDPKHIWHWPKHKKYNKIPPTEALLGEHKKMKTVAFLVIKNDSILSENYYEGYHKDSLSNSFSMAKSITEALLGKAIKDGYVKMSDKVRKYLPELKGKYAGEVTVADVASMSSGSNWIEDYYNPFHITTEAYFSDDLDKLMLEKVRIDEKPGQKIKYLSGDTQLMGMIISKATGMSLSEYLSQSFWQPMGARKYALWTLDGNGKTEKAFCCVNSNARDFARFGKLYEHFGNWEGQQILDTAYVKKSLSPRLDASPYYGYSWWLSNYKGKKIAYMRGVLGQYVIIIPEDNLIIVRLGKKRDFMPNGKPHSNDFYVYIDEVYKMLNGK
jgi:CubicO group peptidase (beta-lactamase class C family)